MENTQERQSKQKVSYTVHFPDDTATTFEDTENLLTHVRPTEGLINLLRRLYPGWTSCNYSGYIGIGIVYNRKLETR